MNPVEPHYAVGRSNCKTCSCLASFAQDAERSLAALYYCVRETYGERAAYGAAEEWLQVFEERLEGASGLPELTRITAAAIALFVTSVAKPATASRSVLATHHGKLETCRCGSWPRFQGGNNVRGSSGEEQGAVDQGI